MLLKNYWFLLFLKKNGEELSLLCRKRVFSETFGLGTRSRPLSGEGLGAPIAVLGRVLDVPASLLKGVQFAGDEYGVPPLG